MGRNLFQFVRRVFNLTPSGQEAAPKDRYIDEETEKSTSLASVIMIVGLSLYIVGGLGYFAKTHAWDNLNEQQKAMVVQAMMANDQML